MQLDKEENGFKKFSSLTDSSSINQTFQASPRVDCDKSLIISYVDEMPFPIFSYFTTNLHD